MKKRIITVLLVLTMFFSFSLESWANAVAYEEYDYHQYNGEGYHVVPHKNSGVSVVKENIKFDFKDSNRATVSYVMKNKKDIVRLKLAFPYISDLLNEDEPLIKLNNVEINYKKVNLYKLGRGAYEKPEELSNERIIKALGEYLEGKSIEDIEDGESRYLSALLFEIDFQSDEKITLEINYYQPTIRDREYSPKFVNTYNYLLAPAKYFDSFGDLTIEVIPDEEYKYMTDSNISFEWREDRYVAKTIGLPVDVLKFDMYPEKSYKKKNQKTSYLEGILLVLSIYAVIGLVFIGIVIFLIVIIVKKIRKNRR